MRSRTIHHPADFVSREIRPGSAASPHSNAGRPDAGRASQDHAVHGQPPISAERAAAAKARAAAMHAAREQIRRVQYVSVEQRDDVMRIMVERGLTVDDAYDAYVEEGEPSPRFGGKLSSVAR